MTTLPVRRAGLTGLATLVLAGSATLAPGTVEAAPPSATAAASELAGRQLQRAAAPTLDVRVREHLTGLDHPWDVAFTPDNTMLVTERDRERIVARLKGGEERVLAENPPGVWHSGETGLMGIEVDPDFAANRNFYTCHGSDEGAGLDIRVVKWHVDTGWTAATQVEPVVTGMPVSTGRHGGCRLRFGPSGALYVGTGDAAQGTNPQDLSSLGGKVLRVDPDDGGPWPGNPYEDSADADTRLVWTYGHRNVQGLAYRKGAGIDQGMWSVEHGPDRDDEVNELVKGGNAGWDPAPGYDESVPMTDHSLGSNVFDAAWSSGVPTLATSGATWLRHKQWGAWQGRLAVAALKDTSLQVMQFTADGALTSVTSEPDLDGTYGRLRTAQTGPPKGALYLTTDNGGGADAVLKVTVRE